MSDTAHINDLLPIAAKARGLGTRLGGDDEIALTAIAEVLDNCHGLLTALPGIMERQRAVAALNSHLGCAQMLRELADDIDKGKKCPVRPQVALRQVATALEKAVAENRPDPVPGLMKKGFVQ